MANYKTKDADGDALYLKAAGAGSDGDPHIIEHSDSGIGATGDAAASAGGAGSLSAKLRLVTSQLNTQAGYLDGIETLLAAIQAAAEAIQTAAEILDNTVSGSEQQVDVVTLPALAAGTNNIGDVDVASIAAGDNNIGNVDLASAIPAGTNNIGDVDVLSIAAGANLIGDVGLQPRTSGGLSVFRSLDLDESEEEAKDTGGQVYGYYLANLHASAFRYVKFYDLDADDTTVGSSTPLLTVPVPPGSAANLAIPQGIPFANAITVAATTGAADADTGAPGANEVIINLLYK
jgi:hypothetical protein